jgi:hypothetical protein
VDVRNPVIRALLLILLLFHGAACVSTGGGSTYAKPGFGFVADVPRDWTVAADRERPEQFIVAFGMPEVWSEAADQSIQNAVSITAYRRDDVANLDAVVQLEADRIADILVSREEVESEIGRTFVVVTRIDGLRYKTQTTCHFVNGIGYVIAFTATERTYDVDVDKYERFLSQLSFVPPAQQTR